MVGSRGHAANLSRRRAMHKRRERHARGAFTPRQACLTRHGARLKAMPNATTDELELPPLDGETDDEATGTVDHDVALRDEDNPYDDAMGDDDDFVDKLVAPDEPSALGDDQAGFAAAFDEDVDDDRSESLLGDEDAPGVLGEDFGLDDGGESIRDGGEEGFDAPEPELRVEDLPRLDEGGDDDLTVEEAADVVISTDDLRWDDRGFERAQSRAVGHVVRIRLRAGIVITLEDGAVMRSVDDGATFSVADQVEEDDEALLQRGRARAILRDGVGVLRAIDDGPLTLVESTTDATAFTLLDDGSLIAAIDGPGRPRLIRVGIDGIATVVAEEESPIDALALDPRTGLVWAGGAFGLIAFRPR